MAPPHTVPSRFAHRAFTLEEAVRAGLTRHQLAGSAYRRLGPKVYCAEAVAEDPDVVLGAVHIALPPPKAFSGATAAWLLGMDLNPCDPVEVTVPPESWIRPRVGVSAIRSHLDPGEVEWHQGLPSTGPLRTMIDLGRRAPLIDAVVALDEALHRRLVTRADFEPFLAAHRRERGTRRLRLALEQSEAATESPMETRLRLLIVGAGLPRPQAQVPILHGGAVVARPDLSYPDRRLAIEFDGGWHADNLVEDNRRQNRIVNAGYRLLRFTSADVRRQPEAIVAQIRMALSETGPRLAQSAGSRR